MNIEYERVGDFNIPKFKINNKTKVKLNRYALLKLKWMKENNKSLYCVLFMKNELTDYLISTGDNAEKRFNQLMDNYKNNDKRLSEEYKKEHQMEWIKLMNNYKNSADEIVLYEQIFV